MYRGGRELFVGVRIARIIVVRVYIAILGGDELDFVGFFVLFFVFLGSLSGFLLFLR